MVELGRCDAWCSNYTTPFPPSSPSALSVVSSGTPLPTIAVRSGEIGQLCDTSALSDRTLHTYKNRKRTQMYTSVYTYCTIRNFREMQFSQITWMLTVRILYFRECVKVISLGSPAKPKFTNKISRIQTHSRNSQKMKSRKNFRQYGNNILCIICIIVQL